jgi:hypothetical protein
VLIAIISSCPMTVAVGGPLNAGGAKDPHEMILTMFGSKFLEGLRLNESFNKLQ